MDDQNSERRTHARLDYQARIKIEHREVGIFHDAHLGNFSKAGLYFESDFFLVPGTHIFIGIDRSPYPPSPGVYECYRSVVRWRRYLDEAAFDYGYGVELIAKIDPSGPKGRVRETRRHLRKSCEIPTLVACNRRRIRGVIQNASRGGVFIKCSDRLEAGEKVFLTIPLKNKQKLISRVGEIVWVDKNGLGIKFTRAPGGRTD